MNADLLHFYRTNAPTGSFVKDDKTYVDKMQQIRQHQIIEELHNTHKVATHNSQKYD